MYLCFGGIGGGDWTGSSDNPDTILESDAARRCPRNGLWISSGGGSSVLRRTLGGIGGGTGLGGMAGGL